MVDTMVEVEMQQPKLLIIEAYESRLCSGPETVAASVVNTVVGGGNAAAQIINQLEAYESHLCSRPKMVAAAVVNTTPQPRLLIIKAYESRLCLGPETVAAAVVNTVVEVEDPKAQITDLNISSLKERKVQTSQHSHF